MDCGPAIGVARPASWTVPSQLMIRLEISCVNADSSIDEGARGPPRNHGDELIQGEAVSLSLTPSHLQTTKAVRCIVDFGVESSTRHNGTGHVSSYFVPLLVHNALGLSHMFVGGWGRGRALEHYFLFGPIPTNRNPKLVLLYWRRFATQFYRRRR